MLLSKLTTDEKRWQLRDGKYSEKTVAGIVADGIDLARFDTIPVVRLGRDRGIVGGDGHSRLEGIRRLAKVGRLPAAWKRRRGRSVDWEIPVRFVSRDEADRLARTANLGRDNFSPCEEARVFQVMLDDGDTLDQVAARAHRPASYVTRALSLNTLCRDIRAAVAGDPAAGGIDVLTAQVLANGFKRFGVDAGRQQDLWHQCLKHAMLNFQSARKFIDAIGARLSEKQTDGVLFAIPASAAVVLQEARVRCSAARTAKTGVAMLIKALESGGLADVPDLAKWVERRGRAVLDQLAAKVTEDADVLAAMVAA
jgi:hypothetical protein